MLNHFRTLLLNLSYDGDPTEHIPSNFTSVQLNAPFSGVYNLLFPPGSSRYYKEFLAQCYITIVIGAGLESRLKQFDSRISYDPDNTDYFKIYRYSNPQLSNTTYPLFVYGQFASNQLTGNDYDNYLITQVGSSNNVLVYSTVQNLYFNGAMAYTTPVSEAQVTLDFTNPISAPQAIGSTGIAFSIDGSGSFTDSADKTWQFLVEAPYVFPFNQYYTSLKNSTDVAALLALASNTDTTTYQNLWTQHYNPIYQLAGLLLCYVAKLNNYYTWPIP